MEIKRDFYLNQLIGLMGGDMVKVVTGIRRCGKALYPKCIQYGQSRTT